jgi:hypothetical protein
MATGIWVARGRSRGRAPIAAVIVSMLTCSLLTGCDSQNNSQGPVAIKRDGMNLVMAVCADIRVTRVLVYERDGSVLPRWVDVFRLSGSATLAKGQELIVGQAVIGMTTELFDAPQLQGGSQISIAITSANGDDVPNIVGSFQLGGDGLAEGGWQHPDGSVTSQPCTT